MTWPGWKAHVSEVGDSVDLAEASESGSVVVERSWGTVGEEARAT